MTPPVRVQLAASGPVPTTKQRALFLRPWFGVIALAMPAYGPTGQCHAAATQNPPAATNNAVAAGVFDVKAYGATGDGKTLDSDAINRAIDAAGAVGGGTVRFPPGTYVSASIRLKSNLTLYLDAGAIRRMNIANIVASDADGTLGSIISGIPGHSIEDIRISNVRIVQQGGGTKELAERVPPEEEAKYPEPGMFGAMPSYGFFFRHVAGLEMDHVKIDYVQPEARPAFVLDDVQDARFDHLNVGRGTDTAPLFDLHDVTDFAVQGSRAIDDTRVPGPVVRQKL